MISKNTKIAVLIGALFCVVSISACGAFFLLIQKHKTLLYEKRVAYAQMTHDMESITELTRILDETKEERLSLFSRILKEDDVVTFLTLIETIGKEQGVALVTNSLTVKPVNESFETLAIDVSVEGSHDAVLHSLELLEQLPYQVAIQKVTFERKEIKSDAIWKSTYTILVTKYKKNEN